MVATTTTSTTPTTANLRQNKIRLARPLRLRSSTGVLSGNPVAGLPANEAIYPVFCSERFRVRDTTEALKRVAPPEGAPSPNHVQFNSILARMMGPNGGLCDPHVLQHTAKINTCKIPYLNCDQASH
jgi:hypothetical protein